MKKHINHNQRGMELVTQGQHDAALDEFEIAALRDPRNADYQANIGLTLLLRHRTAKDVMDAIAVLNGALQLNADLPIVYGYLGAAYGMLNDDGRAVEHLLQGLEAPSTFVLRHLCLVYFRNGCFHETLAYCDALLDLDSKDESAHFNRSLVLLTLGRYDEGWEEFIWRTRMPEVKHRCIPFDHNISSAYEWQGEDISDKHLLLHFEAGMGDSFQFCRFISDLAKRCAKLSVYERPELRDLFRNAFGSATVTICDTVPDDVECFTLMMETGRLLHLTLNNVDRGFYLQTPQTSVWHERFQHMLGLKVGIVWAGRADNPVDARRSLCLENVKTLFDLPVTWVSLQLPSDPLCPIYDAAPYLLNWSDTAAVIDALDLIIVVDTSVAHLAAAMGKPVWLLNRFDTCWRWGVFDDYTPWYPTMRIFRQPRMGDWASVIAQVAAELMLVIDQYRLDKIE